MNTDEQQKIGILTFSNPENLNYGALLQTFALYTTLKKLHHKPYVINWFEEKEHQKSSSQKKIRSLYHYLVHCRYSLSHYLSGLVSEKKFIQFSDDFMPDKSPKTGLKEMHMLNDLFDTFIVGSDQVWRYQFCPDIETFFLGFVHSEKKKIAYAASFGTKTWDEAPIETTRYISKLLSTFKAISVRERSGIQICKDFFNTKAVHILDPVFLLTPEEYDCILETSPISIKNPESPYAAIMFLDYKNKRKFSKVLHKKHQIKTVNLKGKDYNLPFFNFTLFNPVHVWLNKLKNAEYIVTDSYHCIIFCILYQKKFAVLANKNRGVERIACLLSLLGLESVYFKSEHDFINNHNWKDIDYDNLLKKINSLRKESVDFLKNSLR